jgi:hypothetical protein
MTTLRIEKNHYYKLEIKGSSDVQRWSTQTLLSVLSFQMSEPGLAIKNPPKKTHPKKPTQKNQKKTT